MKKATATIDRIFTWFEGSSNWSMNWQIANTLSVDGVHAQDASPQGAEAILFLHQNRNEEVSVTGEEDSNGTWLLNFNLQGRKFKLQASSFYEEASSGSSMPILFE